MKVTVDIYKVVAVGRVELDAKKVEEAKDKALLMAKAHSVPMSKPKEQFIAVTIKAVGSIESK